MAVNGQAIVLLRISIKYVYTKTKLISPTVFAITIIIKYLSNLMDRILHHDTASAEQAAYIHHQQSSQKQ